MATRPALAKHYTQRRGAENAGFAKEIRVE
jgi:hypothetical protein